MGLSAKEVKTGQDYHRDGDPGVLSVLPFRCDPASPCRAPKSKCKTVWLG